MRWILPIGVMVLVLLAATDASAQCVKCGTNNYTGCLECRTTTFNASTTCQISGNGSICASWGPCQGDSGEQCFIGCVQELEASNRGNELKLQGEWQLVAVKIVRPEKRPS